MPTLTVTPGVTNVISSFLDMLDDMILADRMIYTINPTQLIMQTDLGMYNATGVNLAEVGDNITGTLFTVNFAPTGSMESLNWTNIGLDLETIGAAYQTEGAGGDPAAVENLLLPLDWSITFNDLDDVHTAKTKSDDGVKLHFDGNDYFNTKGGNDNLFTADGKDTVFAGIGDDTISGGNSNDRLYGEKGADFLIGGNGRDILRGGKGSDFLQGDRGRDNLDGGWGEDLIDGGGASDKLRGGAGSDLFVFFSDVSSGDEDVIYDYELGVDIMDVNAHDVAGATITDNLDGNAVIAYDDNTIEVIGVTAAELVADNSVLIY